jgi:hypothetical protein
MWLEYAWVTDRVLGRRRGIENKNKSLSCGERISTVTCECKTSFRLVDSARSERRPPRRAHCVPFHIFHDITHGLK